MPESANPGGDWVAVYSKTTGRKTTVPARFLDHPVLGAGLRKTPLARAKGDTNDSPAVGDKEKKS